LFKQEGKSIENRRKKMDIKREDILEIISCVGGKENISLITHCVTRLRFVLKDETRIREDDLKEISLVKGCFAAKGQYQVIIGPGIVDRVYEQVLAETGAKEADSAELKDIENQKMNGLQRAIKVFADVFYPILPAIVGAGLLLGISNILTNGGIFGPQSVVEMFPALAGLASMITMVANTAFTYIPVLVCWSATKRFGGSPMLGVFLGLVFVNAELISGASMSAVISGAVEPQYWNIFGINILKLGYQNSVLPAFAASWLLALLERKLKEVLPDVLHLILVAPVAVFVTSFLTFLAIGPAMNQVATWLTDGILFLFDKVPVLAGFAFGALWEPLVVTGMHHALIAVNLQLVAATQQSSMLAIVTITCVAEAGAVLAMGLLSESKNKKSVCISSAVSAMLGVTEPSMFGVTLPAKFPFICSIISSGIAGIFVMISGIYTVSAGPSGPLCFTIIPAQFWGKHYLYMALAFVLAFVSTYFYGKMKSKDEKEQKQVSITEVPTELMLASPVAGKCVELSEVNDETFASGMLGDGLAIIPAEGVVTAPADGVISALFPTGHAAGMTCAGGVELLIHVGIDTVSLDGKGFHCFVKQGDNVKKGQKLIEFDSNTIHEAGLDDITSFIISDKGSYETLEILRKDTVAAGDDIMRVH